MRVGIDLVDIDRMREDDEFLSRFFTAGEAEYINGFENKKEHIAGFMAAKEAVLKAIGIGISGSVFLTNVEILHGAEGRPFVKLLGEAGKAFSKLKMQGLDISISHSTKLATAICIIF